MARKQSKVIGGVFQGGSSGSAFIWVGDVGTDPAHRMGHGNFLAQVCKEDIKEATEVAGRVRQGVPTSGDINGGSRA